jgi:hypothetical protein
VKLPEPYHTLTAKIDRYHEERQEKPRAHFGLSGAGHECERYLWLSFRWAVIEKFQGRILRLFRRGHREEITLVEDLRNAGLKLTHAGADPQKRVSFGANVSGSLDGIILGGVPESPEKPHILEMKTHSKKSFDDLVKKRVQASKPMHYAQMQVYMLGIDIDRALYVAICKDDDRIYTERVRLDREFAEKKVLRAKRIAMSEQLPPPISTRPDWYQCKFCSAYDFCHETRTTKEVNCRTCAHSTPLEKNGFKCERWGHEIPTEFQHEGCRSHVVHPGLLPESAQLVDSVDEWTAIYKIGAVMITNGENGLDSESFLLEAKNAAARLSS